MSKMEELRYELAKSIYVADNANSVAPEDEWLAKPYSQREYAFNIADALLKEGWRK